MAKQERKYVEADGYEVVCQFDEDGGSVEVHFGGKTQYSGLGQPRGCIKPHVDALRKLGKDPSQYRSLGSIVLRLGAALMVEECCLAQDKLRATEKASLIAIIPGLEELQAALDSQEEYQDSFSRMMADEDNDGARPPSTPVGNVEDLRRQYPRATLYLRAEAYSQASNHHKASAGEQAMEILAAGGKEEEAAKILDNWLPEDACWN